MRKSKAKKQIENKIIKEWKKAKNEAQKKRKETDGQLPEHVRTLGSFRRWREKSK
ncbi:MAG: hypothetical protein HQ538_06890 [Parcubacteria group bacterium]|nr:hypothetical protein [Parcubacteria group bacterium]